jgi:hypothetical protein
MRVLAWPVVFFWRLLTILVAATGRLIAVVLGVVLLLAGGVLTLTVVGAPIGVPLAVIGLLLLARGLF